MYKRNNKKIPTPHVTCNSAISNENVMPLLWCISVYIKFKLFDNRFCLQQMANGESKQVPIIFF